MAEFVKLQKTKTDSDNSWSVDVSAVDQTTFDLSVKNPNKGAEVALREPKEILKEMKELDKECEEILDGIIKII